MLSKDRVKRIAKVTLWQRMLTGLREGLGLGPGMPELTAQYSRGAPSSLMLMKFWRGQVAAPGQGDRKHHLTAHQQPCKSSDTSPLTSVWFVMAITATAWRSDDAAGLSHSPFRHISWWSTGEVNSTFAINGSFYPN